MTYIPDIYSLLGQFALMGVGHLAQIEGMRMPTNQSNRTRQVGYRLCLTGGLAFSSANFILLVVHLPAIFAWLAS